jgi:ADP-ribosylation factor GTPase-activating protein 2/3
LKSKDPKTKYGSAVATKYKEELKRRAERDRQEYVFPSETEAYRWNTDTFYRHPGEVVIEGDNADSSTPAGEPDDDFFSSWDKPAIKKPTPPISRTSTPPVIGGRTPSPFIAAGANGKDIQRTASPLSKIEGDAPAPKPTASRITSSAALRKTTTGAGPRKANVLGAKKVAPKLGAKKVTADVIDFDEAEKKAKEEAERIAKLGYDPEAEEDDTTKKNAKTESSSNIVSPTPVSPVRGGYGSGHSREKSASEVERLGMGVARLGFGQIGGAKAAAGAQKKNMGGFGSVGPIKASQEGQLSVLFLLDQPYVSSH